MPNVHITLSQGMSRQDTLDGLLAGYDYTVTVPSNDSDQLTVISSVSQNGGQTWFDFDSQGFSGGAVATGGTAAASTSVRIPDTYNVAGNLLKVTVTVCIGTWVLTQIGELKF